MMNEYELINSEEIKKATEYYRDNILKAIQVLTGLTSSKPTHWFLSAGHMLQGALSGRFIQETANEWNKYEAQGKIRPDFKNSETNHMCLAELLRYLDEGIPDADRFDLLKKIYLVTAAEGTDVLESPLPLQFMQLARSLNSGEILVLFAAFRNRDKSVHSQDEYIGLLTDASGLQYKELTNKHFETLFNRSLLRKMTSVLDHVLIGKNLFSSYGLAFCEYISRYDDLGKTRKE